MENHQNQQQQQQQQQNSNTPSPDRRHGSSSSNSSSSEPAVRSRWTPKPEQILILESIFNSGMVNPPKDETVRIRKLLEKFGSVGDANVFYWFQNRRSRSRRRQRQIQASLVGGGGGGGGGGGPPPQVVLGGGSSGGLGYATSSSSSSPHFAAAAQDGGGVENLMFSTTCDDQMCGGLPDHMMDQNSTVAASILCSSGSPSHTSNLHYQTGFITVLINGVPTEVPRGTLDMKAMFGEDLVLIHSSGMPVPFNEYGYSIQSLQHGESYFLVSRSI